MNRSQVEAFDSGIIFVIGVWLILKAGFSVKLWWTGRNTPEVRRSVVSRAARRLFLSFAVANIPLALLFLMRVLAGPEYSDPVLTFTAFLRVWFLIGVVWNIYCEFKLDKVTRDWALAGEPKDVRDKRQDEQQAILDATSLILAQRGKNLSEAGVVLDERRIRMEHEREDISNREIEQDRRDAE